MIRARLLLAILLAVLLPRTTFAQIVVNAPPSLAATALRIEETNIPRLRESLERAGLPLPAPIRILLLARRLSCASLPAHRAHPTVSIA